MRTRIDGWRARPGASPRKELRCGYGIASGTAVLLLIVSVVGIAGADVNDKWEWVDDPNTGEPRRNLRVWVDPDALEKDIGGIPLEDLVNDAMSMWNMVQSCWTFTMAENDMDADVTVEVPDKDFKAGAGGMKTKFEPVKKGSNLAKRRRVLVAKDPRRFDWGTEGETKDPRATMNHELGHTLRLAHMMGKRAKTGKTMDPGGHLRTFGSTPGIVGDHDHNEIDPESVADAVEAGGCVANPEPAPPYPDNLVTVRVERDDPGGLSYSEERPHSLLDDCLDPIVITMPPGSINGPNPDSAVTFTFRPYNTDWKFGQVPEGLLDGIAGIEISAKLDPGVSIDSDTMLHISYPLATPAANELDLDLGDAEFEGLITPDFRVIAVSMAMTGSDEDEVDTESLEWADVTAQANPDVDTTDPDTMVFTFSLPASMFVDAALPEGHFVATSVSITSVECRVDFDFNGVIDVVDSVEFTSLFNAGDPEADLNDDGEVNILDYVRFLELFQAGCM